LLIRGMFEFEKIPYMTLLCKYDSLYDTQKKNPSLDDIRCNFFALYDTSALYDLQRCYCL
jgi:hypothetical protein